MKAVVVTPGHADSGRLQDVPEPEPPEGEALVRVHQVGLDGTDAEILAGEYGEAPPGDDYLTIGHESLGRVVDVMGAGGGIAPGDWVVAIVRRPDPVPCSNCAVDEWDMCLNGKYTERGIKGLHGFLSEYYTELPKYLVKISPELAPFGVLLEPLTIAEKAWDQIGRIQSRLAWKPERALVLGAGPVGLLAAAVLRLEGLDVHVYDAAKPGLKSELSKTMGASYICATERKLSHELAQELGMLDIVFEATGFSPLAFDAMDMVGPNGIVCLSGVSGGTRKLEVSVDHINLEIVLGNKVIFGTVNANRRHFVSGVDHLQRGAERWPGLLERMITRRLAIEEFEECSRRTPEDIKKVIEFSP